LAHQQLYVQAMKTSIVVAVVGMCLACLQAAAQGVEERKAATKLPAAQPPLSLRLSDEVIHKAVRETLAESPGSPKLESGKVLSGDPYQKFSRAFSEAEKPGCLHPDATKFQSPGTVVKAGGQDYNVGAGGLFALPFWAAAIVRGKCR
jgi:hypothetical protein